MSGPLTVEIDRLARLVDNWEAFSEEIKRLFTSLKAEWRSPRPDDGQMDLAIRIEEMKNEYQLLGEEHAKTYKIVGPPIQYHTPQDTEKLTIIFNKLLKGGMGNALLGPQI